MVAPRALSGLLALTLVACGGRYSSSSETSGGAGSPSGSMSPGQGGRSTGTGGAAAGGNGVVGMAGGAVSVGGSPVGAAGTPTGSGGASVGVPIDTRVSCQKYCDALALVCPERESACLAPCYADQIGSRCQEEIREGYDCVTAEVSGTGSCAAASSVASKLCGAVDFRPPICGDLCDVEITFDDPTCHGIFGCGARTAELYCSEESGLVRCSCWAHGQVVAELMVPQATARDACLSPEPREACLSLAAP